MSNAASLNNFTGDYAAALQPQLQPQERIKHQSVLTDQYKIPLSLCIRVIHSDEHIVVIDKPCNLRSVPGHATRAVDIEEENDNDARSTQTQKHPASRSESRKRPRQVDQDTIMKGKLSKMTAQEAWVEALRLIAQCKAGLELPDHLIDIDTPGDRPSSRTNVTGTSGRLSLSIIDTYISQIAIVEKNLTSIPRKGNIFNRYWKRNHKRIISSQASNPDSRNDKNNNNNMENLDDVAAAIFHRIETVQQELLRQSGSVPRPTGLQESAWGQLILLGFGGTNPDQFGNSNKHHLLRPGRDCPLYIVHRLDCETSGVMVFARTKEAASFLSQAWRERTVSTTSKCANLKSENETPTKAISDGNCDATTTVSKMYLALVHSWPPWQQDGQARGEIHLNLMPSEERLKWKVVTGNECGVDTRRAKPSSTLWSVVTRNNFGYSCNAASAPSALTSSIRLELIPLTGRTHQLRIHCATIGRGIVGDSLYGDSSQGIKTCKGGVTEHHTSLRLHAHKLSFLHPASRQRVQFEIEPEW